MDIAIIVAAAWSLLTGISLGIGANELHRRLVNYAQRADAVDLDLQKALYSSLLKAIDALGKTLCREDHHYFQSILDLQERHSERQRVRQIFKTIRAQFPSISALKSPVPLLLEDTASTEVEELLQRLGLKSYLGSLPEALLNAFQANLPSAMLVHFRQRVATDDRLHAVLQLDITMAGIQVLKRELRALADLLHQHCGGDDPAEIQTLIENPVSDLRSSMTGELDGVKRKLSELETEISKLSEAVSEIRDQRQVPNLRVGFYPMRSSVIGDGISLPYHNLGGPGLERLCYALLLSQGYVPRYFGKPGQKQYGIDLLVTQGSERMVYQCKNVKSFPLQKMREALELFEDEWLGHAELPRPNKFVLCCPLSLQDRSTNEAWTILEREFYERTDVAVTFWDRDHLDTRLRKLPDIVADLFSDKVAEQFCDLDDWNSDRFRPVMEGSGNIDINRYLSLKAADRVYVDPELANDFAQKLETNGRLLIKGLPGSGKTITTLALAQSLQQGRYRVFYVDMRQNIDVDTLVEGIRRRLSKPTIFLLDNCQGKFERLYEVQDRVLRKLRDNNSLLILIKHTTITPEGMLRGDYSDLEETLEDEQAVLEIESELSRFRQIISLSKPKFAGLSEERLRRVFEFTGHDLLLLDHLMDTINSPDEIDRLEPEGLFEKTMIRYFGAPTGDWPGFNNLTALAQFDLAPPVSAFHLNPDSKNKGAAAELVLIADRPPRYFFLHPSAAELIFRSLTWKDRVPDYATVAVGYLIEFFKNCRGNDRKLAEDLSNVLGNHLKLEADRIEENRLKSLFLADDNIHSLIEESFEEFAPNLLALCLSILKNTDQATFAVYYDLVERKIDDGTLLDMAIERPFWESSYFLVGIRRDYPALCSRLSEQTVNRGISSLIKATELQNVLLLLANLSEVDDPRWTTQLELVSDSQIENMIQRTIASGRSIGTINLALRELKNTDERLLAKLEDKIGSRRYIRLITSAGTIFELFMIIRHSSLGMAEELIDSLDSEIMDDLVDKTIASGRSIGTINLALRELKNTDERLLAKLERRMGTERWWRLICQNGDLAILRDILRHMDRAFREELAQDSQELSVSDWEGLLLRGNFANLCLFVRRMSYLFSKRFTTDFIEQLETALQTLVRTGSWDVLSQGAGLLAESSESSIKKRISDLLYDHICEIEPSQLEFDSFSEPICCIRLLWKLVPSRRKELADSLMSILPEKKDWYADEGFLRSSRFLFLILAAPSSRSALSVLVDPQIRPEDAQRGLAVGNAKEVAALLDEATTLDVLFYVWNFYALWFEWQSSEGNTFAEFLHPEIYSAVSGILAKRLWTAEDQEETDNLIALAGLISFLKLPFEPVEKPDTISISFERLLEHCKTKTFIPAAFFLLGLECVFHRERGVPQGTWRRILLKAERYSERTAALEHLQDFVRTRAGK